jgi:hypothetical protein
LTNCPTCGAPVAEGQRFCGNCGTDVQAASAYRAAAQPPPPTAPPGPAANPFGYSSAYDYTQPASRRPTTIVIALVLAGIAILCLCCGIILGAAGLYLFGPTNSAPTPTPTPVGLDLLRMLFMG